MKKKFISIILTFLLAQPLLCFAEDSSSESSVSTDFEDIEDRFEIPLTVDDDGTEKKFTVDVIQLLAKSVDLEKDKKQQVLKTCVFKDTSSQANEYDSSAALIAVICESVDKLKAYVKLGSDDEEDVMKSSDGTIQFLVPKNKDFSVSLKSNKDVSCDLGVMGVGMNNTLIEGYPMSLTCENGVISSENGVISSITQGLASIALMLFVLF